MSRIKDFLDPAPANVRERPLLVGTILLVLVVLVVNAALTHNIPLLNGKPGYAIEADFASVNQVNDRTPIRVQGVGVGTVESVGAGADPRRSSRVTLRITDEDLVVHRDARAAIRWRTVLGGSMYVDLDPGSPGAGKLGDAVLPKARTSSQTELDDVLRIYDGGTEQAQRDTFRGLGDAFGSPRAAGEAIKALPKLRTVERGLEPVRGSQAGDLRRAVAATATTVQALGADVGALQGLVTGANRTLAATTARRDELGQFLELSPATLDSTKVTMRRVRTTLGHLDPLVVALRPGARRIAPAVAKAKPALREAASLLTQARPVLRDAAPTFGDLRRVARAGTPIIRGLEPTIDRLNGSTIPFLDRRDEQTRLRTYEAIGPHFSVLDMGAAEFDAEGFRLHLSTLGGSNSVITAAQGSFARSCRMTATPAQDGQCERIGGVLARGWFGAPRGAGK